MTNQRLFLFWSKIKQINSFVFPLLASWQSQRHIPPTCWEWRRDSLRGNSHHKNGNRNNQSGGYANPPLPPNARIYLKYEQERHGGHSTTGNQQTREYWATRDTADGIFQPCLNNQVSACNCGYYQMHSFPPL